MATGDKYVLTDVMLIDTVAVANVFYINVLDDSLGGDLAKFVSDTWESQVLPDIISFQTNNTTHDCTLVRKVEPLTEPSRVFQIQTAGARPTAQLPSNQAIVMSHYSGSGERTKRGRYYLAGLAEVDVTKGRLTEAAIGMFSALAAQIQTPYVSSGYSYQIQHYSKKLDTYFDIDATTTRPCVTKLRSRTPGICPIT